MAFCNNHLGFSLICPTSLTLTFQLSVYFKCLCKQQRIPLITEPSSHSAKRCPAFSDGESDRRSGWETGRSSQKGKTAGGREGGRHMGACPAVRKSETEQGVRAASHTGISGSCERDMCNHRAWFSVCGEVTGVIAPTGSAPKVLAGGRGSVLYRIFQFVPGNGQTDVLRTEPNSQPLPEASWSLKAKEVPLYCSCRRAGAAVGPLRSRVSLPWTLPLRCPTQRSPLFHSWSCAERAAHGLRGLFSRGTGWGFFLHNGKEYRYRKKVRLVGNLHERVNICIFLVYGVNTEKENEL